MGASIEILEYRRATPWSRPPVTIALEKLSRSQQSGSRQSDHLNQPPLWKGSSSYLLILLPTSIPTPAPNGPMAYESDLITPLKSVGLFHGGLKDASTREPIPREIPSGMRWPYLYGQLNSESWLVRNQFNQFNRFNQWILIFSWPNPPFPCDQFSHDNGVLDGIALAKKIQKENAGNDCF